MDDLVRSRMKERNIPGAAIAVVKNGRIVKIKGYGLASVEFSAPVTNQTVFEIGSVSKQMTAAAIMLLVEDGKIFLDEKISKYLPTTPDTWKDITVRNLLTHTSGIKSYSSLDGFELSRRLKVQDFIKQLSPHALEFTPGERNIYSNSGFNLLAYIIESVSEKKYMQFMREKIFLPLGMKNTGDRDPQFIIPLRAIGYEWSIDRLTGRDGNLTDLMGAGSIVSTITDMTKWEAALRGEKFLKKESKAELWKQFTFNNGQLSQYGLGWRISDIRGHKLIGHTGQTAGFGAAIFRYVDNDTTVIALTNLGESGMGSLLASSVAKMYVTSLSLRKMQASNVLPNSALLLKISAAIAQRMENNLNPDNFSDALIRSLSTERAKSANKRISSFGPITKFVFVGEVLHEGRKIYRGIAETPRRIFLWRFVFDNDEKILEMTLEEEE
ncbi:MAG: serine hydrolase domain-containing protein [Blastocatellia bacterium]